MFSSGRKHDFAYKLWIWIRIQIWIWGSGFDYVHIRSNPIVVPGLRSNLRNRYFWSPTVFVDGYYSKYGYHPSEVGVINTRITYKQQAEDWLNATSFILNGNSNVFTALQRLSSSEGYWLGKNGKYYKTSWGGNRWTGARANVLKVSKVFKWGGIATTTLAGSIDIYIGYQQDGGTIGHNTGKAMAGVAGGVGGSALGAWGGAAAGTAIGAWFGGVGAIPGAIIGGIVGSIGGSVGGSYAGEAIYDGFVK